MTRDDRDSGASDADLALTDTAASDERGLAATATAPARETPWNPTRPGVPERFGRFVCEGTVGRGGMGTVFRAHDPELDRYVAIKVLHAREPGSQSGSGGRERLVREAQALARLSHPNVVAVHEVGTAGDDVFVAMELVEGETLARWLAGKPRWPQVVAMFAQAGRGLAAAHAAGLVHRDFKPDNVLVGRDGRARVTDFGLVAQATDAPSPARRAATNSPLDESLTRTGAVLGTPRYMAPEQHADETVDARADQFSFCVALYEALYRRPPFDGVDYESLARNVREGTVRSPPAGDVPARLAAIVLRGLAREPAGRFRSMDELLAALERAAKPRRRGAAIAGAMAIAGAVALLLAAPWRDAPPDACAVPEAKLAGVWDAARRRALAVDAPVLAALDDYARAWSSQYGVACRAARGHDAPAVATAHLALACLERRRGELAALVDVLAAPELAPTATGAIEAARGLPPPERCADPSDAAAQLPPPPPDQAGAAAELRARLDRVKALTDTGRYRDAAEAAGDAVTAAAAVGYAPLEAEALLARGNAELQLSNHEQAAATTERAALVATTAGHHDVLARAYVQLYLIVGYWQQQFDEAARWEAFAEAALARAGDRAALTAELDANRGAVLSMAGRFDDALTADRRALDARRALFGDDHPVTGASYNAVGESLRELARYDEALASYERALASYERLFGGDHPRVAAVLSNMSFAHRDRGALDEAIAKRERVNTIYERVYGRDHEKVAGSLDQTAVLHQHRGDPARALPLHLEALAIMERRGRADDSEVVHMLQNLGNTYVDLGEFAAARDAFERALALAERRYGPDSVWIAAGLHNLAYAYLAEGDAVAAEPLARRSLELAEAALGPDHPLVAYPLTDLGRVYLAHGQRERARDVLERALALRVAAAWDPRDTAVTRFALAQALWQLGRDRPRALELARTARDDLAATPARAPDELRAIEAWLRARE